jgi:hypothetical protein
MIMPRLADGPATASVRRGSNICGAQDGKDEDFTHWADRTITAGTRKTARRVRIASH